MLHSTELASFFNGLGDVERSAKPLCAGSIPARASKFSHNSLLLFNESCRFSPFILVNILEHDSTRTPWPTLAHRQSEEGRLNGNLTGIGAGQSVALCGDLIILLPCFRHRSDGSTGSRFSRTMACSSYHRDSRYRYGTRYLAAMPTHLYGSEDN